MISAETGSSLLLALFTAMAISHETSAQAPTARPPAPVAPLSMPPAIAPAPVAMPAAASRPLAGKAGR